MNGGMDISDLGGEEKMNRRASKISRFPQNK
jgi:hypothetical protein